MNIRNIFALLIGVAVIVVGIVLYQNRHFFTFQPTSIKKQSTVTIDGHTFYVSIANTLQEKVIGLSGRKSLDQNAGMLFPFDKPDYYGFWMKGMEFPLDIIYINNNKIVTIVNDLPAPTGSQAIPIFKPATPANTVLEINAGLSRKYNFKIEDIVQISL